MEKTTNYQLNQWDAADPIRREDFNADNAALDAALAAIRSEAAGEAAAAQATGDRGLGVLKKLAGDVCRLAYQQDGKGTYTGWREGIAFDGLNADHQVESTSGAAILEPDEGRVRLAVDGWSGGAISLQGGNLILDAAATGEFRSDTWSPAGYGTLTAVTFNGYSANTNSYAQFYAVLMRGDEELAATDTRTAYKTTGSQTYTFSPAITLEPQEIYHLKIVAKNPYGNVTNNVYLANSATLIATAVRNTTGGFTAAPFALTGTEIQAWVQYSDPGAVTMDLLDNGQWVAMALERETGSEAPEGTACRERAFKLTVPEETDSVQLRVNISSESECCIYGYGAVAL